MNTKPFLHKHYLLFDYYELLDERCNQCIDLALNCERCNFWLHKDCAERQLPSEISDPLNSERTLRLECFYYSHFMCSKCFRLSKGYGYSSSDGSFVLDVVCASSSSTNWEVEEMDKRYKDVAGKQSWFRFGYYSKPLTLVKYRKVGRYEYTCSWCHQSLSNTLMSYIYLENPGDEPLICLHEGCLSKIPNKINFHHFHPYHPLYIQRMNSYDFIHCIACGLDVEDSTIYSCGKCSFYIHILCSNLKPTLKHYTSHHHPLTYIRQGSFRCSICQNYNRSGSRAFYRCVECDFNVHVECLIPSSVEHKYHRNSLALVRFFIEDGSTEQYCDICEQRRDLQNHVYYCKECKFTAHIECALNMVNDTRFDHGTTSMLMHEETQQKDVELGTNCQMEHPFHPHPLNLKRLIEIPEYRMLRCMACCWEICEEDEQVYVCTQESLCRARGGYICHKTCAKMPIDLNLIHIHHHPLTLISEFILLVFFMCNRCGDVSNGFKYVCLECSFKLDIKCAADLIASKTQNQVIIGTYDQQQTKLSHFSHPHELLLGYVRSDIYLLCRVCGLSISGPTYICFACRFSVHQSCLVNLPSHIEIPFHPIHTLYPYTETGLGDTRCLACKEDIYNFGYRCSECNIYFHYKCTTSLRCSLTSNFHPHKLYLFHDIIYTTKCQKCGKRCESSCYLCIECNIAFHLRCIQVPDKVKCKHHIHNLILKDRFIEDDSGEYYCDICEKERYHLHSVYSCQECDGTFVAHIECALAEQVEDQQLHGDKVAAITKRFLSSKAERRDDAP